MPVSVYFYPRAKPCKHQHLQLVKLWLKEMYLYCLGQFRPRSRNFWKRVIFIMYVRPSVRKSAWNNMAPTGRIFRKFHISVFFRKYVEKSQVSSKSDKNNCTLHADQWTHFCSHLAQFFSEWEIFHTKVVQKIKTPILNSKTFFFFFFSKILPFKR